MSNTPAVSTRSSIALQARWFSCRAISISAPARSSSAGMMLILARRTLNDVPTVAPVNTDKGCAPLTRQAESAGALALDQVNDQHDLACADSAAARLTTVVVSPRRPSGWRSRCRGVLRVLIFIIPISRA